MAALQSVSVEEVCIDFMGKWFFVTLHMPEPQSGRRECWEIMQDCDMEYDCIMANFDTENDRKFYSKWITAKRRPCKEL